MGCDHQCCYQRSVARPGDVHYVRSDADHLTFEGKVGTATLSVQTERMTPGQMLLINRGFHWISEQPFNQ